jgi:hypothetical protein
MTHTVYLEDTMDEILPEGEWHWRDERGWLVLNDIRNKVRRARGEEYKQARDDKRTAAGRLPRWKNSAAELAAYCDPTKQDKSFRARFANTNAIFDTIPDGWKQALEKKTRQEKEAVENCPLCAQKDSQWHRLFLSDKPKFKLIQEKAHKLQLDKVAKTKSGLLADDGWIDVFTSAVVRVSCDRGDTPISTAQLIKLRKIIRLLTIPLRLAVRSKNLQNTGQSPQPREI